MSDEHDRPARDPRLLLLSAFVALLAGCGALVAVALLAQQVLR